MARFKIVCIFLLAWLAASVFWGFLLRLLAASMPDNRIVQGLIATGQA